MKNEDIQATKQQTVPKSWQFLHGLMVGSWQSVTFILLYWLYPKLIKLPNRVPFWDFSKQFSCYSFFLYNFPPWSDV